mgnify:CR=1 FL=1
MRQVLYGFPVTEVEFYIPRWVEMLPRDHRIKADLLVQVKNFMGGSGCQERRTTPNFIQTVSISGK